MDKLTAFYDFGERLKAFMRAATDGLAPAESFDLLALDLFTLQRAFNPIYRGYCESLDIDSPRRWEQIPFLSAVAFKDFEVSVLAGKERTAIFRSSGTTQQNRGRHFHNQASLELYEASLVPWFKKHLLSNAPKNLGVISLTPEPRQAPESSLVHMFDVIRRRFASELEFSYFASADQEGAWKLDLNAILRALKETIRSNHPVLILGTAFSFVHLLDGMDSVRLPPGSRVMETGGYKGRSRKIPKEELHCLITAKLGLPLNYIVTEYGMSELSSQAYDTTCGAALEQARFLQFPPWVRTRIVSPETGKEAADGEIGLLQILDLANAYSVAAIETEDLAHKTGLGFNLLGRAEQAQPRGCSLMPAT